MKAPSEDYARRKAAFERCLTVYGRKTVLEALQSPGVRCERLHLARSNRGAPILDEILDLARARGAEIREHDRQELARISRHAREDQGVAADIAWPGYQPLESLLGQALAPGACLIAVDGITNPQNLGMLIRSATAGGCAGILLPREGGCDLGSLAIKASAGTVFRATILRCRRLSEGLESLSRHGWLVSALRADARKSLFAEMDARPRVFVLGGESGGVGKETLALAGEHVSVPMAGGVESLNVAVTAALVAYAAQVRGAQRAR